MDKEDGELVASLNSSISLALIALTAGAFSVLNTHNTNHTYSCLLSAGGTFVDDKGTCSS